MKGSKNMSESETGSLLKNVGQVSAEEKATLPPLGGEEGYREFFNRLSYNRGNPRCTVSLALEALQGKWTAKVAFHLLKNGCMRFGELKCAVPNITSNMLTSTLRDMETRGLVVREQFNEIPPHVEYSLTEDGEALLPVFYELARWGRRLA